MYRRTGDLYTSPKSSLMDLQSVEADTAEGRNQRRVDIDDLISVFFDHGCRDLHEISCQHDEVQLIGIDFSNQGLIELLPGRKILRGKTLSRNPMLFRALQSKRACVVADDDLYLRIADRSRVDGIQDRLKIRSSAGNKNADS